ncbi:YwqJ-related putative deaminase [Lentzea sp. DG1S-22]|uniref:YwqJ-related putative deaminase n=1 Tax=Lentzea sp. DG1S-22 TaxID=3108822 RepID=UPI003FA5967F
MLTHNCGDAISGAKSVADTASSIRPDEARPVVAEAIQLPSGRIIASTSVRQGRVQVHPAVQAVLNTVSHGDRGRGHGQCGLVVCLSQALFSGESPVGSTGAGVTIRKSVTHEKHGGNAQPCGSCQRLVEHFGINWLT